MTKSRDPLLDLDLSRSGLANRFTVAAFYFSLEAIKLKGAEDLFFRLIDFTTEDTKRFKAFLGMSHKEFSIESGADEKHMFYVILFSTIELFFCRLMENFVIYVTDIISLIYRVNPKNIRSEKKYSADELISYEKIEEVRALIANDKIARLSRSGFGELATELNRLVPNAITPNQLAKVLQYLEMRNAITHRRGVGKSLLRSFDGDIAPRMDIINFKTPTRFHKIQVELARIVARIDRAASKKYRLPTERRADIGDSRDSPVGDMVL